MSHASTASWALNLLPSGIISALSAALAWIEHLPGAVILLIFVVIFAIIFLCTLAWVGHRKQRRGPDRIPLVELRGMATKAGWNINVHISHDPHDLVKRLNQAAVDGLINFWGHKYEYDFGEDSNESLLVNIPISHFVDRYVFSCLNIFGENRNNYYIHTGKIGKTMREQRGEIFQDIHADRRQLEDWIAKNRNVTLGPSLIRRCLDRIAK